MSDLTGYFANDRFARHLGIEILEIAPGFARARMAVADHHLNALDLVHGGAIFGLADLVFAVASNAHGQVALGINVSMSYVKAARGGVLVAEAREVSRNAKLATYSMEVKDGDGALVALMLGTVYRKQEALPGCAAGNGERILPA